MKKSILSLLIIICALSACKEDCDLSTTCQEVPPTNEVCLAAFQSWFYDADTKSCEEIGYSGCSRKGFATKAECESCGCD